MAWKCHKSVLLDIVKPTTQQLGISTKTPKVVLLMGLTTSPVVLLRSINTHLLHFYGFWTGFGCSKNDENRKFGSKGRPTAIGTLKSGTCQSFFHNTKMRRPSNGTTQKVASFFPVVIHLLVPPYCVEPGKWRSCYHPNLTGGAHNSTASSAAIMNQRRWPIYMYVASNRSIFITVSIILVWFLMFEKPLRRQPSPHFSMFSAYKSTSSSPIDEILQMKRNKNYKRPDVLYWVVGI
jgi:hypothetical protein